MLFTIAELLMLSVTCYLWLLAIISLIPVTAKIKNVKSPLTRKRFLIVIPAHDESLIIEKAIKSVRRLNYPGDYYDFAVIADNCEDDTVAKVRKDERAICLIRKDDNNRGKGYALQWAFKEIKNWHRTYDAYVIMDADSEMDPDYLTVIEGGLSDGHKVLQGFVEVVRPERSPAASLIFLGWSLNQRLRHAASSKLGYFGFLLGNGFCISAEIVNKYGWTATSILEDVEYGLILRLSGFKIHFVPEARVYAQNPGSFRYAESQRVRWDHGRYLIMKRYLQKLLAGSLKNKDWSLILTAVELLIPPYTLFVSFVLMVFMISVVISIIGIRFHAPLWGLIFSCLIGYSILGMIVSKANLKIWKSVLYVPVFMGWRIFINVKGRFQQGSTRWVKTERENL